MQPKPCVAAGLDDAADFVADWSCAAGWDFTAGVENAPGKTVYHCKFLIKLTNMYNIIFVQYQIVIDWTRCFIEWAPDN